ncbi:hypothetical protein EV363DRAFT_1392202 [Boletus edulis]|nr:hypothetical protein EV363DRAFT_1392202 [Boletus edulis]
MKSDCGLDHDVTGCLLCPIEYDWNNAKVRKNICERHPQFLVTEGSWPRFLYDTECQYNPNNIEKGLFKSTFLLKTFKLIFTLPTSAQEVNVSEHAEMQNMCRCMRSLTDRSTCSHMASLIGMHSVRPRVIAYAAVQLRFSLSSLMSWRIIDGDFDTRSFYENIVEYFDAPPGPLAKTRTQELLLWWDRKVFKYH